MARAVVIDGTPSTHVAIGQLLGQAHHVIPYCRGALAIDFVLESEADLVFVSLDLKDSEPTDLVSRLAERPNAPPIIAITSSGDPRVIVGAIRAGAFDVVARPLQGQVLRDSCLRALAAATRSHARPIEDSALEDLVGTSPAMDRLREMIRRVGPADEPVLIVGESGVGKELVARAVHRLSPRSSGPFQARNCGALPEQLFESEVFGTERGAYTGAVRRPGAFELAAGGTLFLDEVGELTPRAQVKLLRVLEDGRFHRVGGTEERNADVRIVSATNRDLGRALSEGEFRFDLYYRLNVLQVAIPPLRQRREDIPLLVKHFIERSSSVAGGRRFSMAALERLSNYHWPGNIRELRNVVQRAAICAEGSPVRGDDIQFG